MDNANKFIEKRLGITLATLNDKNNLWCSRVDLEKMLDEYAQQQVKNTVDLGGVSGGVAADKCICQLNAEGESISGMCFKHKTGWL